MSNPEQTGYVTGFPLIILRIEGIAILIAMVSIYKYLELNSLKNFLILFLLPDLGILGYLINNKWGAFCYNLTHSYIFPLIFLGLCYALAKEDYIFIGVIWIAHIGFDRALGFGLKYGRGFAYTHLLRLRNSLK